MNDFFGSKVIWLFIIYICFMNGSMSFQAILAMS